jgi:dTDP-4-dehydrorhamnose reductase
MPPTREDDGRHLDTSSDKEFLAQVKTEYSLFKAKEEDIFRNSTHGNWTIVRPTIAYSRRRFQLVTLEAPVVMYRAINKLPVLLPEGAMDKQATMTWSGDIGKMLARLTLKSAAMRETYTLATAEHHTWQEIAEYYRELVGLEYKIIDTEAFSQFRGISSARNYQLMHSRCQDKYYDNTKILNATGIAQADLMPLKDGLRKEIEALPKDIDWGRDAINERMDAYLKERKMLS